MYQLQVMGILKRISQRSYKASENTAFGKKDDDQLIDIHYANTLDKLLVFTDKGNYLFIPVHKLEEFKWKELGKHISYLIKVSPDEKMIGSVLVKSFNLPLYIVLASQNGQIKRVSLSDFEVTRFTKALKCMNLKNGDVLKDIALTDGHQGIVLTTQAGYATLYSEDEISLLGVKAGGIKGINLRNDVVVSMNVFNPLKPCSYVLISDQPGVKRLHISDIPSCNRATKGSLVFKSPKSNIICSITALVLDTQDSFEIYTNKQKELLLVKDYGFTQLDTKPSVITSLKNQDIVHVFNPIALSTDMYDVNEIVNEQAPIFEVKKDPDLFDEINNHELDSFKEKEIITLTEKINLDEQIQQAEKIKEKKESKEKHFEPISFDDLFNSDEF